MPSARLDPGNARQQIHPHDGRLTLRDRYRLFWTQVEVGELVMLSEELHGASFVRNDQGEMQPEYVGLRIVPARHAEARLAQQFVVVFRENKRIAGQALNIHAVRAISLGESG